MELGKFYEAILGLPDLKVEGVETSTARITLHCKLDKKEGCCPKCGEPSGKLHQYKYRQVQDLRISGKEVWLHLKVPQLYCITCDVHFNLSSDWLLKGKSYTRRQEKWIFDMCARQPFTEVGALENMNHKKVERLYFEMAERNLEMGDRYSKVRHLGIDELSHRKGKKDYVCVLVDLERNTQLDVLPDRKKETLVAHFQKLGKNFCDQIELVCCDIWKPYILTAEECFPNAEVVLDRFHIVKALNGVLDNERKVLRKEDKGEEAFKGIKWKLFKRPEKCNPEEKDLVKKALDKSWILSELYEMRNTFNSIFDFFTDKEELIRNLELWAEHASQIGSQHMDKFLRTLRHWQEQIANFSVHRITNAATEGLNNFIRYFKRISFGISNFEHMRLRILANSSPTN